MSEPNPPPTRVTLDRALSKLGLTSRKQAQLAIQEQRVKVNGRMIDSPGKWVTLGVDRIVVDGAVAKPAEKVYLALHKPRGLVTTRSDEQGRRTVYECLGDFGSWVFPVGRLDRDTSGLLLFTNDTDWSESITAPEKKLEKEYLAKVEGHVGDEALHTLRAGVYLDDGTITLPAKVRIDRQVEKSTWLSIIIVEGKYRQVRRMCEGVGHPVTQLIRLRIGSLVLGELASGVVRKLTPEEVEKLVPGTIPVATPRVAASPKASPPSPGREGGSTRHREAGSAPRQTPPARKPRPTMKPGAGRRRPRRSR
jgi:23S rRNA pseudouridine2605 synthase